MDSVEKLIHLYSATIFFASNERGMAYICYLLFLRTIILPRNACMKAEFDV